MQKHIIHRKIKEKIIYIITILDKTINELNKENHALYDSFGVMQYLYLLRRYLYHYSFLKLADLKREKNRINNAKVRKYFYAPEEHLMFEAQDVITDYILSLWNSYLKSDAINR